MKVGFDLGQKRVVGEFIDAVRLSATIEQGQKG